MTTTPLPTTARKAASATELTRILTTLAGLGLERVELQPFLDRLLPALTFADRVRMFEEAATAANDIKRLERCRPWDLPGPQYAEVKRRATERLSDAVTKIVLAQEAR